MPETSSSSSNKPIADGEGNVYQDEFQYVQNAPITSGDSVQYTAEGFPYLENAKALAGRPTGQLDAGNIDLNNRPVVKNEDGSISTVRSMSFNEDGKEILIPTVAADGSGILDTNAAIQQYRDTGQHLGTFDTPENADAYAQRLHEQQATQYDNKFSYVTNAPKYSQAGPVSLGDVAKSALNDTIKLGKHFIDAFTAGPKLMQKVSSGELDPNSDEALAAVNDIAMNFGIGGLMTANLRPGVGMFGGRMSRDAVHMAERMEKQGFHETSIKDFTGLERGAEGKWRKEIADTDSRLDLSIMQPSHEGKVKYRSAYLGAILKHDKLFEAYPELMDIPVFEHPGLIKYNYHGAYSSKEKAIYLNPKISLEEARSTLLHEIQHAIQDIEGFSNMAKNQVNPALSDEVKREFLLSKEMRPTIKNIVESVKQINKMKDPVLRQLAETFVKTDAQRALNDAEFEVYRRLASEVEARNVEKRLEMSPQIRRFSPARKTEDVPREKQIVSPDQLSLDFPASK